MMPEEIETNKDSEEEEAKEIRKPILNERKAKDPSDPGFRSETSRREGGAK